MVAKLTQLGRDLYWTLYAEEDGFVRWVGYNDRNWWDNVSGSDHARTRLGKTTGREFKIDFHTGDVIVAGMS